MTAPPTLDILAEHDLGENLQQVDLDRFRDKGVPPAALIRSAFNQPAMVLRNKIINKSARFEFARYLQEAEAIWAFTLPVFDLAGDAVDIAAWRPPDELALWLGRVSMLGEEQVFGPNCGEGLHVHSNVLSWFRARRSGVVILEPRRAVHLLREAGSVFVDDPAFGRRLRKALAAPPLCILLQTREACEA